jgi:glycosyltransferase involved in cell wall biosynthesis
MARVSEPLVTTVIPAFNDENFVAEAIEGALSQTYPRFETIVVDDGSTDSTAEIAARYPEVKLISQENRGVSEARNAGVAAGTGELLAFNDADDVMLPHRLEVQVEGLLSDPRAGCVLGSQELMIEDESGLPFWARGTAEPLFAQLGEIARSETPDIYTVTALMSRQTFDRVGGFDPRFRHGGEDADILLRLIEEGVEIVRMPEVVVRRRVHGENMTHDQLHARTAVFEVFKRRIERHRERHA